ncbi:Cytochrome P450 [Actinacidiphila yanglinensis]|uniref:Cytochrome P450 n=1 Tax=Actinacidiphila yanglinensis TaxID=310779 RepID=A0A1H5YUG1_9ACTN|nr:cytochrome P450 [Actinacidiphila yanglinensis]SEG27899.1 Cytochrome P450 [Actinacidiphila yanglinensis]
MPRPSTSGVIPAAGSDDRPPGPAEDLELAGIRADPLIFLQDLVGEYGDLCSHRTRGQNVWFANTPELVQHILKDNYTNYTKAGTPDDFMLTPLLGKGLLTSNGAQWERQRRLSAPSFRRVAVESFDGLMVEAADDLATAWGEAADRGEAVRVDHDFTALTLRVVASALLGSELTAAGRGFGQAVDDINRFIGHFDGTPPQDADFRARLRAYTGAKGFLDRVVRTMIGARRLTGSDGHHGDLLDAMLGARDEHANAFSDQELHDQVLTMVMAGHETTAKALSWTLHLLDRHPEHAARVREEIDRVVGTRLPTAADLSGLVYTRQCLDEAIRLFPPVWLISRLAVDDDMLGGFRIPAGTLVCVSPWTLHRHPDHWEAPEEYRPERFEPEQQHARAGHAYLPFGGGPRVCIGQAFATTEAMLVLTVVLQRLRLTQAPGTTVVPEALVTLRPRDGLLMTVERRHG